VDLTPQWRERSIFMECDPLEGELLGSGLVLACREPLTSAHGARRSDEAGRARRSPRRGGRWWFQRAQLREQDLIEHAVGLNGCGVGMRDNS
jgi:hypothetical protein